MARVIVEVRDQPEAARIPFIRRAIEAEILASRIRARGVRRAFVVTT
jgi:hypothetical protein